jgi:FemAB-related protein (PEP-CTERM system-associated)
MSHAGLRVMRSSVINVQDDASASAADTYVDAHPHACSYHRRRWLDVIAKSFGHETKYLVAETAGHVAGVLPLVFFNSRLFGRFAVSVPFVNYGGVLADDADVENALVDRAILEARNAGSTHLELRHRRQHFSGLAPKRHKVAMQLRLAATTDDQWSALDRKLRNQVRKAEKSGLQSQDGGAELLPAFYEVFARNMRDLGTPVYSVRFFQQVLGAFPHDSRVFVVTNAGRPVAASVVHWYRKTIEVPWASSLREFNPLCANVLLYWHMLRFALARGFQTFDFGRSTPGEGTYHFKKQWDAEAHELVWEYWTAKGGSLPQLNPHNPKFGLAIRAWQRLPVRVANTLGPMVVRNIP